MVNADGVFGGAAGDEFEDFGAVYRGVSIGAGYDRGDTASGSGEGGGAERFLMPLAGFANLDANIDDTGCQTMPTASLRARRLMSTPSPPKRPQSLTSAVPETPQSADCTRR